MTNAHPLSLMATAALFVATASPLLAQATKTAKAAPSGACHWARTDAWVVRQTAFFDDSKHDWSDDTLRTALLQAAGIGGQLATPVQYGVQFAGTLPTPGPTAGPLIEQLKKVGVVRGATWPTRSVVGAAGTHAVYLLAQHDTALARMTLKHMMEAGPTESPAIDVAVFEDNLRLRWGRKQLYGTQFIKAADGRAVLAPMEDSTHADLRREGAGLPPFKLGLCFAEELP